MQLMLIGFVIYFIIIGIIAAAAYRVSRKSGGSGYSQVMVGNRSINYVMTALSAHASDMSDWLFMAFPAALYSGGLINGWISIGLIAGMWITWSYIAPQLRKQTEQYNCLTLSTYFEQRFGDSSGTLRILSAAMALLFFAVYIAAGLKGFGYLAQTLFGMPYAWGTAIGALCALVYVVLGGYYALAWIDCFQALFLLLVIFVVPLVAWAHVGGWAAISSAAAHKHIPLMLIPESPIVLINTLLMAVSWAVGYFGTPHILTKFMGITDVREIPKAKYIGMTWQVLVLTAAGLVGLLGIAYFPAVLPNKELVFVSLVKELFSPLVTGFILSAVAGATLSVVTAQILVLVCVLTEDFYRCTLRPRATDHELLWVYRGSLLLIVLLSFWVSLYQSTTIQQLVYYAWMGFGCSFGPLVLLSLHSAKINRYGAAASILVGGGIAATWHLLGRPLFLQNYGLDIPAVVPGFILSICAAYAVSALTAKK